MGALNEDDQGRIQCPVRGCGQWHHRLSQHLSMKHPLIGGADGIRAALSIPRSTSLYSARARAKHASAMKSHVRGALAAMQRNRVKPALFGGISVAARNWSDTCPAQLQNRIVALANEIGSSPSAKDFRDRYGRSGVKAIIRVFGSWNAAKALCGLACVKSERLMTRDVCESLSEWVNAHGDLPSPVDAQRTERAPRIPSYPTILKAFGVGTWDAAMRSAVEHLGIRSERYGSPVRRSA
jgi:hypothetical protein